MIEEVFELLNCLGYELVKKDGYFRFQNEVRFVDVWDGKKGITIGVYNPKTRDVDFHRRVDAVRIENILTD